MANFIYGTRDHRFILKEWLDMDSIFDLERYNMYSKEDISNILNEGLKVAKDIIAPSFEENDSVGAQFKDGQVTVPEGLKKAFHFIQENGWGACNSDPDYGAALPQAIYCCIREYFIAANGSMTTYYGAITGSAELIHLYGSEKVKNLFLEKMYEGKWAGTMDLTEPGGGSDLGHITTKAFPTDTPGLYKIKGTKCFISGGEQDITENIIHCALARIEGSLPGTAGISLFAVPKIWVNDDGSLGQPNDLSCIGIEHKMGLKGNATCVMAYGENDACYGWLLGDPPDESGRASGLALMFKMMNGARLGTGMMGMAEATAAYNFAAQYTTERVAGVPLSNPTGDRVPIIKHEDVKRMLLDQKATTEAVSAMVAKAYYWKDIIAYSPIGADIAAIKMKFECLTPLIKAYGSDTAWDLIAEAIQCLGGYGYSEEFPLSQLARDVKVYSIWEGTNFVQAMDFSGRKWKMNKGAAHALWLGDIEEFTAINWENAPFTREIEMLESAVVAYKEIKAAVEDYEANNKISLKGFYATKVLHAAAKMYSAYLLLDMAIIAEQKIAELGEDHFDYAYYKGKILSAKYYVRNILPEVMTTTAIIKAGDDSIFEIDDEIFLSI